MVNFSAQLEAAFKLFDSEDYEYGQHRDRPEDSVDPPVIALRRVCNILRNASEANLDLAELNELAQQAAEYEDEVIEWAYYDSRLGYNFFPIYSGNEASNEKGKLPGNSLLWCLISTPECLTREI